MFINGDGKMFMFGFFDMYIYNIKFCGILYLVGGVILVWDLVNNK